MSDDNPQDQRLYGVPESVQQRPATPDRLELFVDEGDGGAQAHALQEAVDRIFSDPAAAAEFQQDPKGFLTRAGLAGVAADWDSAELSIAAALGDATLQRAADDGDVAQFVDRLTELGLVPDSFDLLGDRVSAMGFAVIPVVFIGVWAVVAVWVAAFVAAAVNVAAVVNAAALVNAIALVNVLVISDAVVYSKSTTFVDGPGGDNPDDSEDASSPIIYFPKLNNPHVVRLMQKTLDMDLLQRMAGHLHNQGFGAEVSEEIVKRAMLAVWEKYTTGSIPDPAQDRLYMDIVQALATPEIVDQLPELTSASRYAMLAQGFAVQAFELMVRLREPVRLVGLDFNPADLLVYQKVLIVPTGALYGLDTSATFKARLEEYVRLGGICICMAQQHGYDFAALPGQLEGYGWAEDQSCHARSVVITAPHPVFAGQDGEVMDVSIDGFFTAWPETADVLLRRRVNGQPALLAYPYEEGRVVVTTAYADWGVGSNQLTLDERLLMRDMFSWARLAAAKADVVEFDPDQIPFKISMSLRNTTDRRVERVVVHTVDPDKQVVKGRYSLNAGIDAGGSATVTLETGDLTSLGYWSLDADLLDADGAVLGTVYDTAVFLVNNYDDTLDGVGYKSEAISFSAVADEERLLVGQQARIRLLIWNTAAGPRRVSVQTTMRGLPPETRTAEVPPGRRVELVYLFGPLTEPRPHPFFAYLFDENGKSLGSSTKAIFVEVESGEVKVAVDKSVYRPGETITVSLDYSSTIRAAFDAQLLVAITDPSGTTLFDQRFDDTLRPRIPGSRSFSFVLPATVRYGAFRVSAEMSTPERRLAYQEVYFTPALRGQVEGRVLNAVTGAPATEAQVRIDNQPAVPVVADTGAYTFTADAGGHWINVSAPGYNGARAYTVVAPERAAQIADIYVSPTTGQVDGFVVDLITNNPVAGVRVSPDNAPAITTTDDGAFALDLPRGNRTLTVTAPGYLAGPQLGLQVYPSRRSHISALFVTPTQGQLLGVVKRADTGQPLPGAEILSRQQVVATSDDTGAFALTFPTGSVDIEVRAPGLAHSRLTVHVPAGRAVHVDDVLLVPLFGEVSGLVYDTASRAPIAGARVTPTSGERGPAVTGQDGQFTLRLRAENQTLDVKAVGYGGTTIRVSVPAGKSLDGLDLGLVPLAGTLEGVVLSSGDGVALPGARISDGAGGVALSAVDGTFTLTLPARQATVRVEAPDHQPVSLQADIYPGRATRVDTIFLVELTGRVRGRLVDSASGAPIVGGHVRADGEAEGETDADGAFELQATVGMPRLVAEAEGYHALSGVRVEVFPGRTSSVGALPLHAITGVVAGQVLAPNGTGVPAVGVHVDQLPRPDRPDTVTVEGTVVDRATGLPIPGARVQVDNSLTTFTDHAGAYRLPLVPGLNRVTVEAPGYRAMAHAVRMEAGWAAALNPARLLPTRGDVTGRVVDTVTAAPLAHAKVWSTASPGSWTLTDDDGHYSLTLGEGEVSLRAAAVDHLDHPGLSFDVVAGQTVTAPDLHLTGSSAWVEGTVRDAVTGSPVPAALVWASDTEGATTDADGVFRLTVTPGVRTVKAMASGYRGQGTATLRVLGGATAQLRGLLLFPALAEISGVVRSAVDDAPVPSVRVWADADLESGAVTDAEGRFSLSVGPGSRRLQAQGAGYLGVAAADVFAYPGRSTRADVLRLVPNEAAAPAAGTGSVAGQLLDAIDRRPVADTLVWWDDADLALGALQQEGGTVVPGGAPWLGSQALTGDPGWTDYRVTVSSWSGEDGGWGILLRYRDDENHYRFVWVNDTASGGPLRRLERVAAGVRTVLAEDVAAFVPGRWSTVEAAAEGDVLTVRLDGRVALQARDSAHAAGRVGVTSWSQRRQLFREISVTAGDSVLLRETCRDGLAGWSVSDAAGAVPSSVWRMVAPQGVLTDADGRFRFDGVPSGDRTLFMSSTSHQTPWYDNRLVRVFVYNGRAAEVGCWPMPRSGRVRGTLRDSATGEPLAGVVVRETRSSRSAVTGATGTFVLELPAGDGNLNLNAFDIQTALNGAREVQCFGGQLTPGNEVAVDTVLEPGVGEVEIALSQEATAGGAVALPGVEVFHGDPDLRTGAFVLQQADGGGVGGSLVEGPAVLTGSPNWTDTEIRFQARCNTQSGWGAVLRYRNRHSCYRLLYQPTTGGDGGARVAVVRRDGGQVEVLAETRRPHDPSGWSAVRFAIAGPTLTVEVDGNRLFEVSDTALTGGRAGLIGWGSSGTALRGVAVTGPEGPAVDVTGDWDEEPGFGPVGGSSTAVTGPVSGEGAADAAFARYGTFDYHFPVPDGRYRVEVTFAEHVHEQPAGRRFQVTLNGRLVESDLDLLVAAGFRTALRRSYSSTAAGGWLHLTFRPLADTALVNFIRVWPEPADGDLPLYAVSCGAPHDRTLYQATTQFGTLRTGAARTGGPVRVPPGTSDRVAAAMSSYVEGTSTYRFDLAPGEHTLDLFFAEHTAAAVGQRVFNVLADGAVVVADLDLTAVVGRGRLHRETVTVQAAGVTEIALQSVTGSPVISAIAVDDPDGGGVLVDCGGASDQLWSDTRGSSFRRSTPTSAITDDTGTVRFEGLPPTSYDFRVRLAGWATAAGNDSLLYGPVTPGRALTLTSHLRPLTGSLAGLVVDATTGTPIADAEVWFDQRIGVARSGPDGRFRLEQIPLGSHDFSAAASGYRGVGGAQTQLQAQVDRGAQLDATIALVPSTVIPPTAPNGPAVTTDADGRWQLVVPTGQRRITLQGPAAVGRRDVTVASYPGQPLQLNLQTAAAGPGLPETGLIDGRVSLYTGAPVPTGARVNWGDRAAARGMLQHRSATSTGTTGDWYPYRGTHALAGDLTWTDVRIRLEAQASDDDAWGVVFRYRDETSYYRFFWLQNAPHGGPLRRLERVSNGAFTTLAEDRAPYPGSEWVAVDIHAAGGRLTTSVNGRVVFAVNDTTHPAGRFGLYCWSQQAMRFRDITVTDTGGQPLFADTFTQGRGAWSVVDAPGATPASVWEVLPPTGTTVAADGTFRLDAVPVGTPQLYLTDPTTRLGSGDGRWMSLPVQRGDRWTVDAQTAPSATDLEAVFVDAAAGTPLRGIRAWLGDDPRQVVVSGEDGRVRITTTAPDGTSSPPVQSLYAVPGTDQPGNPSPRAHLAPPARPADPPRIQISTGRADIAGTVHDAVRGGALPGIDVAAGDPDQARGSIQVTTAGWSGDPVSGVLRGPCLVTDQRPGSSAWNRVQVRAAVRLRRAGGVALLARTQNLLTGYRAVLTADPDRGATDVDTVSLTGAADELRFTRRVSGNPQTFTGTLGGNDSITGTFTSSGGVLRFTGRRRTPVGSGRVEGEWVLNAAGSWLRLELSAADGAGLAGRCHDTSFGGSVARLERWSGGQLTVLAQQSVATLTQGQWSDVALTVNGAQLRLEVEGLTVLEATDAAPLPPGGAGIESFGASGTLFRDLSVTAGSGDPSFTADFTQPLAGLTAGPGWGASGGSPFRVDTAAADDDMVLAVTGRSGDQVHYTLGLPEGRFAVQLGFAEHRHTADGLRLFDVYVNDELVDPAVDLHALAGPRRLLVRRYQATSGPAGVQVRLRATKDQALVNNIRVWPAEADPDRDPPLLDIRAGLGDGDPALFCATTGWGAQGGSVFAAPPGTVVRGATSEEAPLLLNQRQNEFRYVFDLPPGQYGAQLVLAELQFPTRAGARIFDVHINGAPAERALDVAMTAGDQALRLQFDAVSVGNDRRLIVELINRSSSAIVNLIRIVAADGTSLLYQADAGGPTDRTWDAGLAAAAVFAVTAPQGAVTDAGGAFTVANAPTGPQPVTLRRPGFATLSGTNPTITVPLQAGRPVRLGLNITPATATFTGQVVDIVTGAPIPDAEVWYANATARWRTDETGAVEMADFPLDTRDVFVRAAGYRTPGRQDYVMSVQVAAGQVGRYRLFLTPTFSAVEGVLLDAVTGATVDSARIWLGTQRRGIVTGADGRFLIPDFPSGDPVALHAAREGYASPGYGGHLLTLQAVSGRRSRFTAYLQPTFGVLTSKILDLVTGEPVVGALVYVDGGELSTTTDQLGQFRLPIPAGDRRIYVESVGYIAETGRTPSLRVTVTAGKTTDFTLYLKQISGTMAGQVLDSVSMVPVPGALVYVDEGFSSTLTDSEGRYQLAQPNREHALYVKAVDYASDREDGWMASAVIEPSRQVAFNHMLRPTLQLVSFAFTQTPDQVELVAGQRHVLRCRVRNTGRREGGATVRLVIPGFTEQDNTEWIAPGDEAEVAFEVEMPDDAVNADHQEIIFDLVGTETRRLFARVRGPEVTVEAALDKATYEVGEDLVLRLRVTNGTPGSFTVYTRAQIGDVTTLSKLQELDRSLEVEHTLPVDPGRGKVFFGVYLDTGRALYLNAFYVPRADDLLSVVSDRQVYAMGDTMELTVALTEAGRVAFAGAATVPLDFRLIGDDGSELQPYRTEQLPTSAPMTLTVQLPAHLRQGTCLVQWMLGAGDQRILGLHLVDVRGYKGSFSEFLTDRRSYLHEDTVNVHAVLDLTHPLNYRLEMKLHEQGGRVIAETQQELTLPAGRSTLQLSLPLSTTMAGYHQLQYVLYGLPPDRDLLLITGAIQGIDVEGPTILAVNTDRRRYRPGDAVQVSVTARGEASVTLRLRWDTGDTALEQTVVLEGTRTLTYQVAAPQTGARRLEASLVGDTVSTLSAPALVRE